MSGLLDTSVIVRYLVGHPPEMERVARHILDEETDLSVSAVVLAETAFVLGSVYGIRRERIVDRLVTVLRKENVRPLGMVKEVAIEALMMCASSGRVSFVDALTWAEARSSGIGTVFTLDGRFPSTDLTLLPPR